MTVQTGMTWSVACAFGLAPSNSPKSLKQTCIDKAQADYQNTAAQLQGGLVKDMVKGATLGVIMSPVKGCVAVGVIFSAAGPEGFPAGCALGGLAGMTPAALAVSALQGASGAALWDTGGWPISE